MKCLACNKELTDVEATRKDIRGNYVDMCGFCLYDIRKDITLSSHTDLNIVERVTDDDE